MKEKAGIVIVSYNAAQAVIMTLSSLILAKCDVEYDVILIDNASDPKERVKIKEYFTMMVKKNSLPWHYLQLKKNIGFSGGNNKGINFFLKNNSISHLCLLNSDVVVTDYWLDRLLEKKKSVISAVTNKAYSEQCVPINYELDLFQDFDSLKNEISRSALNEVNSFAEKRYHAWKGNVVECDVTFFCVLLTKEVVKRIGLLDEEFFPGGYEDDDYCTRLINGGEKIFLARDVFIHHFGSASFGQLSQGYFNDKALKNISYFEQKHGKKIQRKPQKPFESYKQDVLFWVNDSASREDLQLPFLELYARSLTNIINHTEKEYNDISLHFRLHQEKADDDLCALFKTSEAAPNLVCIWKEVQENIPSLLQNNKAPLSTHIDQQLTSLCDAVFIKSEANTLMVNFLVKAGIFSSGPSTIPRKGKWKKVFWTITRGINFLFKLKGIVFFGGYPYPERQKDGYFQRIRSIDSLVNHQWRIYVDFNALAGKGTWYDLPEPKVLVFNMNNHRYRWFMNVLVYLSVMKCRTIYFHSVLRMADGNFGNLMKWPGLKKIVDIHGVVPEEFRFHNDFYSARIFDEYECLVARKSNHMLVVTDSMKRYMQHKYGNILKAQLITLPILPQLPDYHNNKYYSEAGPIVVYAGGTHKWQQVPKMVQAMAYTANICQHRFYCPIPDEVIELMPKSLVTHPNILISTKSHNELLKIYPDCHFGFILREDIIVNHAACPTKLVEYLAFRIVPIMDTEKIGDFRDFGMKYITLEDFISGKLPSETERNAMAEENIKVFNSLKQQSTDGQFLLKACLKNAQGRLTSRIKQKTANRFPISSPAGLLLRRTWWHGKAVLRKMSSTGTLPESPTEINAEPCDIVLQVENFLVGGLENAVIDQLLTFREGGYKVALFILGEAGYSAEKAKNAGIRTYIFSYSTTAYKNLLKQISPKIVISHYSIHGAELLHKLNIPFIQVIQNTYMWFSDKEAYEFLKAAEYTTVFVSVSLHAEDYSISRLGIEQKKSIVIPNCIDLQDFRRKMVPEARSTIRAQHGLGENDFVLLSVGAINHQKNHIFSIKALHKALTSVSNLKLVILGKLYEPSLFQEMQQYIIENQLQHNVIYAGESKTPAHYYAMADAFLHASFFEGGPISTLEAIVANLPIIATNNGFVDYFIGQPGFHIIPPPVDLKTYYGKIWELETPEYCETLLSERILTAYRLKEKPNVDETLIAQFDRKHTYRNYFTLIGEVIKNKKLPEGFQASTWLNEIPNSKISTGSALLQS